MQDSCLGSLHWGVKWQRKTFSLVVVAGVEVFTVLIVLGCGMWTEVSVAETWGWAAPNMHCFPWAAGKCKSQVQELGRLRN